MFLVQRTYKHLIKAITFPHFQMCHLILNIQEFSLKGQKISWLKAVVPLSICHSPVVDLPLVINEPFSIICSTANKSKLNYHCDSSLTTHGPGKTKLRETQKANELFSLICGSSPAYFISDSWKNIQHTRVSYIGERPQTRGFKNKVSNI